MENSLFSAQKKVKWFDCLVAGEQEADQGAGQAQEAGGAPKVHARDAPTPETEAGDLEADPGRLSVLKLASEKAL